MTIDLAMIWTTDGVGDIDPLFQTCSGVDAIRNSVAARFVTPPDSLEWAPGEGLDLRQWLGEGLTASDLGAVRSAVIAEVLRDERVDAAKASVELVGGDLRIVLTCATADGPFELELAVSAVSVSIL